MSDLDVEASKNFGNSLGETTQRFILEAWHSVRDTNAINEHIALPNVYNNKDFVEVIKNTLETFVYS